ncbi:MBL fold metallo-hydrolase [Streptodolium elevatio]|uniref:MBL fold metallo-hydrolase n=1 Tax=Streptodolium elevatio TaxID=3157996 RepID=A0ABV3DGQ5_9ACTN
MAPGVFVARLPELDLNVVAVAGPEGFALVDTGSYERETRGLLAGLERMLSEHGLPYRALAVVNTHGHFDHCYGNAEVLRQFPDVEIVAHEALPAYLAEWGERGRADALRYGMPADDMAAVRIVPPTVLVPHDGSLPLGVMGAEVYAPGRGHTGCDVVVHVPDADLLVAGDLLEESAPPSYGPDSYPDEWPGALERVLELPASVLVPGHGALVDRDFAERQLAYVRGRRA